MPSSAGKTVLAKLNEQVKEVEPVGSISFDRYLLSGQLLLNQVLLTFYVTVTLSSPCQANMYRRAGDVSSVYIFLFRFAK